MRLEEESLAGHHIFLVASGAGTGIQHRLWMVPGTSSFLVGATFPYAQDETDEFLGFKPDRYCSKEEALQLAMEAYMRACRHGFSTGKAGKPIGLAITASVASLKGPPHRGEHRIHAAIVTKDGAFHQKVTLEKKSGEMGRVNDNHRAELAAEDLLRIAIGEWSLEQANKANDPGTGTNLIEVVPEKDLRSLFFKHPYFRADGTRHMYPNGVKVMFPGSFNPLHDGHRDIYYEAQDLHGTAAYTICVDHIHKDPLTTPEALRRASQIRLERLNHNDEAAAILFTQGDPLFIQKFNQRPGIKFVVGADTFERLMDPKWGVPREKLFEEMEALDSQLLVCDRIQNGNYMDGTSLIENLVPPEYQKLFEHLDAQPSDLSSSAIRAAAEKA